MNEITQLLGRIEAGDQRAADQLLPLVYDELRRLAAAKLVQEKPGQTLDATGLVHEAYLKLADVSHFNGRTHFFRAAALAMRRILVDQAREKQADKRGGGLRRVALPDVEQSTLTDPVVLLSVDEALESLAAEDPAVAELARLRLFAGLSIEEAGEALGLSRATAFRDWNYARAWLTAALRQDDRARGGPGSPGP